ncbi:hypothetical protein ABZW03_33720 [Kitasatospora sp. NPDC004799]|uniref:hypothetical protein n=1 Tax=Kitasatospora sp. NPDC004799 TaxID=3154460 RepID=UPI0033B83757
MSADERPAIEGPTGGPDDFDSDFDFDLADRLAGWGRGRPFIFAPNGNINTGSVHGDQRVENGGPGAAPGGGERVEAQDGPISATEILAARAGFAKPDCFPEALRRLGTRLLFLAGEPGTGRRSTALNLLSEGGGNTMALRALDSDSDLSSWRPTHREARGYLVHGLSPAVPLGPAAIAKLRARLESADACMVVLLPHDPGTLRRLVREMDIDAVQYTPPPPRAVFDARLDAALPDERLRRDLLERLGPDLGALLAPELVPAQVAELVDEVTRVREDDPGLAGLGQRLSFLAETEVPDLLQELLEDPDALAFLLVTSVLEGLDHRIVRDEADRLLRLADGRLDAVLRANEAGEQQAVRGEPPRPNPRFVFRRSLDELLATIRAECDPVGMRETSGYAYTVEPIRFKRHRQAETVLRHVWRQYGEVSGLLTEWMDGVPGAEPELAGPVGRVMGLAAGWSGGRRALRHIHELARSDRAQSRSTAAYALGIAAQDPVLAGEVKHRLSRWSHNGSWQLRSTVADACGRDFGAARPEFAIGLIRRCYRGEEKDESKVAMAARRSLEGLFAGGHQSAVFRELMEWAEEPGRDEDLALTAFPGLLWDPVWFQQQLRPGGEFTGAVISFVRRCLNVDALYPATRYQLIGWCGRAVWDEGLRADVETLLTALAQDMRTGELSLLVEIDRSDDPDLVGRDIAHRALEAWRRGEPQPYRTGPVSGGPR